MSYGRILLGIVIGNAVGVILCLAVTLVVPANTFFSSIGNLPSLTFLPVLVGIASAWVWKPLNLGIRDTLLAAFLCSLASLVFAAVIFDEGLICLIILAPIHVAGVAAGALAARTWFRYTGDRLNAFLAPCFFAALVAEPLLRGPHRSVVTDELLIRAHPSEVWPHVLKFSSIPAKPANWLFKLGMPYPAETTNGGDYVGAERACIFSGGAVFHETVAQIQKDRLLTFDIVQMPPDPELLGHLDATRGQFELRQNSDGTTTLVGRTWYTLHIRPAWYFELWTEYVFRTVHLRVMENVKRLAEENR